MSSGLSRTHLLIDTVCGGNSPYAATVEGTSSVGVQFLDLEFVKDEVWSRDGRLSVRPYLKDSSLKSVLLPSSGHPVSVHGSWTLAYVDRMYRHSSSLSTARIFRLEILRRLKCAGFDRTLIHHLEAKSHRTFPCIMPITVCVPKERSLNNFWVPLPFHFVYIRAVKRALHEFSANTSVQALCHSCFGCDTKFGAAWRVDAQSLVSMLSKV